MTRELKRVLGCSVVAVELSTDAAELARPYCERLIVGDADTMDMDAEFRGERFDAVLFADVLEHLRDPGRVLLRVRPLLADGGAVIASIPNVAHGSVRLALLNGQFRYTPTGLLDNTHLRFFTRDSVRDLFEAAGYHISHWQRTSRTIDEAEIHVPQTRLTALVREWSSASPKR
jgi:2-polyprenyl-3-methyl-5-hydroxy-6-metoxy-1,4-benzoquinol methylase